MISFISLLLCFCHSPPSSKIYGLMPKTTSGNPVATSPLPSTLFACFLLLTVVPDLFISIITQIKYCINHIQVQPESNFISMIMNLKLGKDSLQIITNAQCYQIRVAWDNCKNWGEIRNLDFFTQIALQAYPSSYSTLNFKLGIS